MSELVFVDTSALYGALDADDTAHEAAARGLRSLLDGIEAGDLEGCTHHGVVIETTALTQRRLGLPAVRALHDRLLPTLTVHWIDRELHERAITALLAAGRREVSLVDWLSFELIRTAGIDRALAFDDDFAHQGIAPFP